MKKSPIIEISNIPIIIADRSTTRIDGAPRWNRTSDAILVGGVAKDGTRQMSIIRLVPGKK